jgi:hypothetical protein
VRHRRWGIGVQMPDEPRRLELNRWPLQEIGDSLAPLGDSKGTSLGSPVVNRRRTSSISGRARRRQGSRTNSRCARSAACASSATGEPKLRSRQPNRPQRRAKKRVATKGVIARLERTAEANVSLPERGSTRQERSRL